MHGLVYAQWIPRFRSASDEIFQNVLLLDLRIIIESYLFNIESEYVQDVFVREIGRFDVKVEVHLDLDKALESVTDYICVCGINRVPVFSVTTWWTMN